MLVGNIVIAVVAVLLTLLAAEPVVRFFQPFDMNERAVAMQYDAVLGWSKVPQLRGTYVAGDASVEHFNSRGLRGPEYPYAKPPGQYRILFLGDSFAEGRLVGFSDTTSEVLKRTLNEAGSSYEVINAGTGGYSTDQELLFFSHEGRKYAPDLTVLMFYENDVWYNAQPASSRGAKPVFRLEGDQLVLTGVPVPREQRERVNGPSPRTVSRLQGLEDWLRGHSAVYQFLQDNVHHLSPRPASASAAVPDEFRVWRRHYDEDVRYAWRVTEALLRELRRQTNEIGSELVVLYVPTAAEVHPELWEATKRRYGLSYEDWDVAQLERELAAVCRRNDISLVDPTTALRAEATKPWYGRTPLYFETDPHWTPAGHSVAAMVLAEHIQRPRASARSSP